ncbi:MULTISPECIES: hypothetical protein [Streptomyces]|uniref:Lipoprotein n=1 Tax=Streptomyces solicathayae TaxID=3081768 RepID=A0ABZ0LPL7_9ACTN|nr:hypothetical protein [Streptomyces sp. HUAS YS2]WOX21245.1 hypothetical protein R2D22_07560 [Streptomyces sp. HUAS YS2]
MLSSAAALLSIGLLAGCGDDPKSEVPSGGGKPSASAEAQSSPGSGEPDADALKFVRCLRDNGLTVDDPESNGNVSIQVTGSQDQAKIAKAQEACKQFAGEGGSGGASQGKETEERKTWRLKVEACMRKKGFDLGNVKTGQEKEHETATRACYQEAGPVPGQGGQ